MIKMSRRACTVFARPLRTFLVLTFSAALQGCVSVQPAPESALANLGELKMALREYHDSGRYAHDLDAVDARALEYVRAQASNVAKPALVLDIDETSLSNWEQIQADDFGYFVDGPCDSLPKGPCGALAWDESGRAAAIAPTLKLFDAARLAHVAVFFVTGRHEAQRAATERNLRKAGYSDWSDLFMRPNGTHTPAAEYKSAQRAAIEARGFTIIANVGDQPSDLAGGHAQRGFLLPNPFYRIP